MVLSLQRARERAIAMLELDGGDSPGQGLSGWWCAEAWLGGRTEETRQAPDSEGSIGDNSEEGSHEVEGENEPNGLWQLEASKWST